MMNNELTAAEAAAAQTKASQEILSNIARRKVK